MGIPFFPCYTTTSFTIMGKLSQQSFSSNPLFSSIVTLYLLILLYFPQLFFNLITSFLLISTLILLLALLRLGASQQWKQQQQPPNKNLYSPLQYKNHNNSNHEPEPEPILVENDQRQGGVGIEVAKPQCNNLLLEPHTKPDPKSEPEACDPIIITNHDQDKEVEPLQTKQKSSCFSLAELEPNFSPNLFLQWEVGAPLEVIYEAFEGVEGAEALDNVCCGTNESCNKAGISTCKYPSLSRYYPESDSESESESDCSSDEEEEREGLIEIALDYKDHYDKMMINMIMKPNDKVVNYDELNLDDEDNLIEIDISPTKNMCDFSW